MSTSDDSAGDDRYASSPYPSNRMRHTTSKTVVSIRATSSSKDVCESPGTSGTMTAKGKLSKQEKIQAPGSPVKSASPPRSSPGTVPIVQVAPNPDFTVPKVKQSFNERTDVPMSPQKRQHMDSSPVPDLPAPSQRSLDKEVDATAADLSNQSTKTPSRSPSKRRRVASPPQERSSSPRIPIVEVPVRRSPIASTDIKKGLFDAMESPTLVTASNEGRDTNTAANLASSQSSAPHTSSSLPIFSSNPSASSQSSSWKRTDGIRTEDEPPSQIASNSLDSAKHAEAFVFSSKYDNRPKRRAAVTSKYAEESDSDDMSVDELENEANVNDEQPLIAKAGPGRLRNSAASASISVSEGKGIDDFGATSQGDESAAFSSGSVGSPPEHRRPRLTYGKRRTVLPSKGAATIGKPRFSDATSSESQSEAGGENEAATDTGKSKSRSLPASLRKPVQKVISSAAVAAAALKFPKPRARKSLPLVSTPKKSKRRPSLPNTRKSTSSSPPAPTTFSKPSPSPSPPLPDFPMASVPTASQQKWDLSLLDESVFVSLPAKRKDEQPTDNGPKFWWPAVIINRNRQNFKVKLTVDRQRKEILTFSSAEVVIPPESLSEDNLKAFSDGFTGQLSYPDARAAMAPVRDRPDHQQFLVPSEAAFKSALKEGKKETDDSLPDVGGQLYYSPPKKATSAAQEPVPASGTKKDRTRGKDKGKAKPRKSDATESEGDLFGEEGDSEIRDLLGGLQSSQFRVDDDSDSDELDPEIRVGTTGLARHGVDWWPGRVIEILPVPPIKRSHDAQGNIVKKKPKNGPYKVETYPKGVYKLWREDFKCLDDNGFCTVPLGMVRQTNKDTHLTEETLHSILPAMADLIKGKYDPGQVRHGLFFGTSRQREDELPLHVVHGEFLDVQIKDLADFLTQWLTGKVSSEYPPEPTERVAELSSLDMTEYISGVMVPTALELMYLLDTPEIEEEAQKSLADDGVPDPSEQQLREIGHILANRAMSKETAWHQKIYTARQLRANANSIRGEIRLHDGTEQSPWARKSKRKGVSYAE